MSKIIDRTGKGAALDQGEFDANYSSLHGINKVITGTTHTVDVDDQGETLELVNAGTKTVTVTLIATIVAALHTNDFEFTIINSGAGLATANLSVGNTIPGGATSFTLATTEYITLQTDSTGAIWNVINHSNAKSLGFLYATQFLRSDANDTATGDLTFSGANTHSGNITISKAYPIMALQCADEATEETAFYLNDELGNLRAIMFRPIGVAALYIQAKNAAGATQANLTITEAGKVNVATGTFQLAGVDVTSTAAELNILDGVTSTAAELNILDGVTRTAAEINNLSQIEQATVQATTSGATKDFGSIPSWIKRITIAFDQNSILSGSADIYVRIGSSATPVTTGYTSRVIKAIASNPIASEDDTTYFVVADIVSTSSMIGDVVLTKVTGNEWKINGLIVDHAGTPASFQSSGRITLAGALDIVRIGTSASTFNAGQVNIIYEG